MAWTETTRAKYRRDRARYASDLSDGEWGLIEPFIPEGKPLGRPRLTSLRSVVNALFYMLETGCQWRMLPKDFTPFTTVQHYFYAWRVNGIWQRIRHALLMLAHVAAGRDADIQDCDGADGLLASMRGLFPWLRHIFADGGYAGEKLTDALLGKGKWTVQIVKRSDKAEGFEVTPKRWVIERTLAWLSRNRRLSKDVEASIASAKAWLELACVKLLMRRLVTT